MNIMRELTSPGTMVLLPSGARACILSFDRRANEVEVTTCAQGFVEAMAKAGGYHEQHKEEMRRRGFYRTVSIFGLRLDPGDDD